MCSQGLGLFAARDIEKQAMVIEYNGTILRNEVAIRKEKIYRSQVFISGICLFSYWINFSFIFHWNKQRLTCPCFFAEPSSVHVSHRQRTRCWCHSKWRACKVLLNKQNYSFEMFFLSINMNRKDAFISKNIFVELYQKRFFPSVYYLI